MIDYLIDNFLANLGANLNALPILAMGVSGVLMDFISDRLSHMDVQA